MRRDAELIDAAIRFAVEAHSGQTRRGKEVAYLWHPLAVGRLLEEAGCGGETVAAGLLHDTLEDTSATAADLRERFGAQVAGWVEDCSEPEKMVPWEERKKEYIERVRRAPVEARCVSAADKVDNLRALAVDVDRDGEATFARFRRGRDDQEWFIRSVAAALRDGAGAPPLDRLLLLLDREIRQVFGDPPEGWGCPR